MNKKRRSIIAEWGLHILAWMVVFVIPQILLAHRNNNETTTEQVLNMVGPPLAIAFVFYTNYLFIIPRFLLQSKSKKYVAYWFISIVIGMGIVNVWGQMVHKHMQAKMEAFKEEQKPPVSKPGDTFRPEGKPIKIAPEKGIAEAEEHQLAEDQIMSNGPQPKPGKPMPPKEKVKDAGPQMKDYIIFQIRDFLTFFLVTALAYIIQLGRRWYAAEEGRQQAELRQYEAELKSLRNQISPHFLLNTLNNIYALTNFDTEKAQKAIKDLSGMLRHMLYDNQENLVDLRKEVDFLKDYVELMKLRQSDNVEIKFENNVPQDATIHVAPLIFISLIENAFKHGISSSEHSFIHIAVDSFPLENKVKVRITNSNFPKDDTDRSGSGIGLQQVKRRLDLIYPDKYEWKQGPNEDRTQYISELTLYTT